MNFKAYDILSSLVPGFIMLLSSLPFLGYEYDKDFIIGYTVIAFGLGYLLNTLGSWMEPFYYWTWGGVPSSNLLDGKGIKKINVYNHLAIKDSLKSKTQNKNACNRELFDIATRCAFTTKDTNRAGDFNNNFAFARTMLTCSILSSTFIIISFNDNWRAYLTILIVAVFWYRAKQRAYYYAKEILQIYSHNECAK